MMHDQTEDRGDGGASPVRLPRWLTELRAFDVCAVGGALGFVAYRCLCG